jgi:hypothetical protein
MYKGKKGNIAGVIVFIEERLPFVDVVPTFSINVDLQLLFERKTV